MMLAALYCMLIDWFGEHDESGQQEPLDLVSTYAIDEATFAPLATTTDVEAHSRMRKTVVFSTAERTFLYSFSHML